MKYPWMPLFWGDFLANTMHLSAQEAGAYLFLIAHAWEHDGEIPADRVRLARIAHVRPDRWNPVWIVLQDFFEKQSMGTMITGYHHHRVRDELHRLGKIASKRKAAAEHMHSKSIRGAPTSTSTSNKQPFLCKEGETQSVQMHVDYRDKGKDYRSPPRAKSDNVLPILPGKPVSQK